MEVKILGGCTKEEIENRIHVIAAAGKLSRSKGNVTEVYESCGSYEDNLTWVKKIIGWGHKSIIEHDYLVFALQDVSPVIEQTIIGNRLTSFTIKSRREVDFRNVGFYTPVFRDADGAIHPNADKLADEYNKHMKWLFNQYGYFVDNGINVEDARFILPYCYHSNIIMGMDGRELEKMVVYLLSGKVSRIAEVKELGQHLYSLIKEYAPYLVDSIEKQLVEVPDIMNAYRFKKVDNIEILTAPEIVSYTKNADEKIILSSLMYLNQCSFDEAKKILKEQNEKDSSFNEKLMQDIINSNEQRELEQISFQIQIPISLAVLTHLTRHRMHSLLIPDFVPIWNLNNYKVPESIEQFDVKTFHDTFKENIKMYNHFKKQGVLEEDLVYFYLSGTMVNVLTTINGRILEWISGLRCCRKAQWEVRAIFKSIVKDVKKIAPLYGKCLGPSCEVKGVCKEGKDSCQRTVTKRS